MLEREETFFIETVVTTNTYNILSKEHSTYRTFKSCIIERTASIRSEKHPRSTAYRWVLSIVKVNFEGSHTC